MIEKSYRHMGKGFDHRMEQCLPSVRAEIIETILEHCMSSKEFYEANIELLDTSGHHLKQVAFPENPKEFYDDFLAYYNDGTLSTLSDETSLETIEEVRKYYADIIDRYNTLFNTIHMGTMHHMGESETDKAYEKLFNLFRFGLDKKILLISEGIVDWCEKTQKWHQVYSKRAQ